MKLSSLWILFFALSLFADEKGKTVFDLGFPSPDQSINNMNLSIYEGLANSFRNDLADGKIKEKDLKSIPVMTMVTEGVDSGKKEVRQFVFVGKYPVPNSDETELGDGVRIINMVVREVKDGVIQDEEVIPLYSHINTSNSLKSTFVEIGGDTDGEEKESAHVQFLHQMDKEKGELSQAQWGTAIEAFKESGLAKDDGSGTIGRITRQGPKSRKYSEIDIFNPENSEKLNQFGQNSIPNELYISDSDRVATQKKIKEREKLANGKDKGGSDCEYVGSRPPLIVKVDLGEAIEQAAKAEEGFSIKRTCSKSSLKTCFPKKSLYICKAKVKCKELGGTKKAQPVVCVGYRGGTCPSATDCFLDSSTTVLKKSGEDNKVFIQQDFDTDSNAGEK